MRRLLGRADDRWIVVGLGNPGERYRGTRHNAGAMALDVLLGRLEPGHRPARNLVTHKSGCLIAEGELDGSKVVLARPASYMNESGAPVGAVVRFYKVPAPRVVVLHDEMDLAFGRLQVKRGGGTAGHNGLRSIAQHLRTPEFIRVRIGIGRPRRDAVDHVLDDFSRAEQEQLPELLARAADATELIVRSGVERAMTEVNARDR